MQQLNHADFHSLSELRAGADLLLFAASPQFLWLISHRKMDHLSADPIMTEVVGVAVLVGGGGILTQALRHDNGGWTSSPLQLIVAPCKS